VRRQRSWISSPQCLVDGRGGAGDAIRDHDAKLERAGLSATIEPSRGAPVAPSSAEGGGVQAAAGHARRRAPTVPSIAGTWTGQRAHPPTARVGSSLGPSAERMFALAADQHPSLAITA
jgi:hypothetical protein